MGKNEIRLRRARLSGKGSERFRNYGAVLHQHEKEVRLKKIIKVFTFFLIILILIALIFIVNQLEEKATKKKTSFNEKLFNQKV
jgi:ABC-type phosphate transport system permease subunit